MTQRLQTDARRSLVEILRRRHPNFVPSVVEKPDPVRALPLPDPDRRKRAA